MSSARGGQSITWYIATRSDERVVYAFLPFFSHILVLLHLLPSLLSAVT